MQRVYAYNPKLGKAYLDMVKSTSKPAKKKSLVNPDLSSKSKERTITALEIGEGVIEKINSLQQELTTVRDKNDKQRGIIKEMRAEHRRQVNELQNEISHLKAEAKAKETGTTVKLSDVTTIRRLNGSQRENAGKDNAAA
jgi:predicted  nucleic acid-binding Zn-ribbon protein